MDDKWWLLDVDESKRQTICGQQKKRRASLMPATIQTKLFNETPDTIYAVDLFQITHKTALKWLSFFANILDRKVLPCKCRKRWNLAKSPRLSKTTVKMVDAKQAWFLCEVAFPPCTAHFKKFNMAAVNVLHEDARRLQEKKCCVLWIG